MVLGREELQVGDLIDTHGGRWSDELVNQIFSAEDAQCITRMSLLCSHEDDVLIWNKSRDGSYSI